MGPRIAIRLLAWAVGGLLGLMGVDWVIVVVGLATFLFLFQIAANLRARGVTAVNREALPAEPVIRGSPPWGWLKPDSGGGAGFPLSKARVRLGRGVDMDILLNNASISRCHAQFRHQDDGCLVEDLESRNGVFVNGARVKEQKLNDGDRVRLGDLGFIFVKVLPMGRRRGDAPDYTGEPRDERVYGRRVTDTRFGRPTEVPEGKEGRPLDDTSRSSDAGRDANEPDNA